MDQIVLAQRGLITQMSGFLTSCRIWGCTTFCDHMSDFFYIHLTRDFTVVETLLAVKAFEKMLAQAGRKVRHYHADNGVFPHNGSLNLINEKDQKITFCAVGAHHQNGIIENKKKDDHFKWAHSDPPMRPVLVFDDPILVVSSSRNLL